jgi:HAD superfamily hydrolase (TIGR01509 family)
VISLRRGVRNIIILYHLSDSERELVKERRNLRYEELLTQGVEIFDGVIECLSALHGHQPMAIVTSSRRDHFEVIHRQTELLPFFEFALMDGDYDRHKPHPDPYLRAAERLGLDPGECLVVEDSERGLEAATRAGMLCIMIPNALARDADCGAAHAVVESALEIPEIVDALRR